MQRQVTIAEARDQLSKLVREAEAGEPIELTRRGQPAAVLLSTRDYQRLVDRPRANFAQAVRELRARYAIGEATAESGDETDREIDELFPRDPSPGRDFRYED